MTITGVISAILIGALIGVLGRLVVPGKQHIPIWLTILVGIGAAFLGTAIARALSEAPPPRYVENISAVPVDAISVRNASWAPPLFA